MKKFSLVLILILASLMLLMPTAAQDATDYESIDPASLAGVTVDFWHQHTGFREVQLNALVAVFNNADVTVEEFVATQTAEISEGQLETLTTIIESLRDVAREYNPYGVIINPSNQGSYGDIFTKMTTGIAAGGTDLPQLVVAYQNQAATYQIDEALVDINAFVDSPTWGLSEEATADFFESFYNSDVFPTYDNARLGFPPNRSMEVMYYNIDWLAELEAAGAISFSGAPQTPEQFVEAACAATENPFSMSANPDLPSVGYQLSTDASRFASWTFAFGGDVFDYENGVYALNGEASVAAMEMLQGMFANGCAVEITESFGDQNSFGQGVTLFTVGSSSGLPFYGSAVTGAYEATDNPDGFQWNVVAIPHNTAEPVQNIYGASVSIVDSTPEQELAAWLFIKYYTDPRVQAIWAVAANYFPVRASAAAELETYFESNPAYATAFDLLQYGYSEPAVANYEFVRNEISLVMAALVQNPDADVQEALDELNELANANLAEMMGN
jgi:multiple sugar transport system substrate-binding protein